MSPQVSNGPENSILLVDDEEIILLALAETLKLEGYRVTTARSPIEAIEILKAKKNLRLVEVPRGDDKNLDVKRVRSGFLVQERLQVSSDEGAWTVPTRRRPGDDVGSRSEGTPPTGSELDLIRGM